MFWMHERNISLIHPNLYLVGKKNDNDYFWELYIFCLSPFNWNYSLFKIKPLVPMTQNL